MRYRKECFLNGLIGGTIGLVILYSIVQLATRYHYLVERGAKLDVCIEASKAGVRDKLKSCEWE